MKKRITLFFVIFFILVTAGITSSAYQQGVKVYVDGKEISSEGKMIDGKVYVHSRTVADALGAQVTWDEKSGAVHITSRSTDQIIPEVIKQVSPCVVGIVGNYKDDIYYSSSRYTEALIHGTGVIIKSTGEILTNAHVVNSMDKIVAILHDGTGYEAELKYIDEATDLAVIKINKSGLKAAKFGEKEDIVIGKMVIAIGTPVSMSLQNSATIGYISGVGRSVGGNYKLIQTDAAINPGNSGGPLVSLEGEVLGINSAKYTGVGLEGLGFSIPVDTIKFVIDHFDKYGKVARPNLGVEFEEDWAAKVGLPSKNGLEITKVKKGSPADDIGFKAGDTLLSINGFSVNSIVDYNEEMKKYLAGDKVTLKIRRNGIYINMIATLEEEN